MMRMQNSARTVANLYYNKLCYSFGLMNFEKEEINIIRLYVETKLCIWFLHK